MTRSSRVLRLILGDQVNPDHSWFQTFDPEVIYVIMEVGQETDYVLHHEQKILAIFAAMRDFARHLRAAGHRVSYVALDDPSNRLSIMENLSALEQHYKSRHVEQQSPDEWRLDSQLRGWAAEQPFATEEADTEHFLTGRNDIAALFAGRKQWLMSSGRSGPGKLGRWISEVLL